MRWNTLINAENNRSFTNRTFGISRHVFCSEASTCLSHMRDLIHFVRNLILHLVDSLICTPKNSIATMALDHSRLGLEDKLLETKSGRIVCIRQVYFTKSCQQVWGRVNQPFILFTSSHLGWNSTKTRCFYHTDLGQNAVFCNKNCTHSIFRTIEARVGF